MIDSEDCYIGCEDCNYFRCTKGLATLPEDIQEELEELRLYKEEHERLKGELNEILHPNGGAPRKPSMCDLVAYVRGELKGDK